ncbi:MAG TPA: hypothetical protein VGR35_21370 [Tepidisphaeraceae bacterium]|nr:hypothetical protein [Tepidisphaeraceae bacterium]
MFRTIHAIAAGAAMMCCTLPAARGDAIHTEADALGEPVGEHPALVSLLLDDSRPAPLLDDTEPAPLVEPRPNVSHIAPPAEAVPEFVWTTDLSLAPPPYVTAASDDSHLAPSSATETAIPLPPAAWTGFASLAGLGTIALIRRLRRLR